MPESNNLSVIIIDDKEKVRENLTTHLSANGVTVLGSYETAQEALQEIHSAIAESRFACDVVLVDGSLDQDEDDLSEGAHVVAILRGTKPIDAETETCVPNEIADTLTVIGISGEAPKNRAMKQNGADGTVEKPIMSIYPLLTQMRRIVRVKKNPPAQEQAH